MLPDYPNVKKKVHSLLLTRFKEQIFRCSPILKQIRRTVQYEGSEGTYKDVDGRENQIEYEEIAATLSLTRDEMRYGNFQEVVLKFDKMAETFAEAQSRTLFAKVSEAAQSVGNVVDAKGKLTKEAFLEMCHKIRLDFNPKTDEPQYPTIILSPETMAKIKPDLEDWEQDTEFSAEMSAIEQQQRLDWRDRESRRRLVD